MEDITARKEQTQELERIGQKRLMHLINKERPKHTCFQKTLIPTITVVALILYLCPVLCHFTP